MSTTTELTMQHARDLLNMAEREINRLKDVRDNQRAFQKECSLRQGVSQLKSDLCHDYDPVGGGHLHYIPNGWTLTDNAVRSYHLLQTSLDQPIPAR